MTEELKAHVRSLFEECGLAWWIRAGGDEDFFFGHIEQLLDAIAKEYARRHGPGFDPLQMFRPGANRDWRTRAFLQAMSASRSPQMLVMVWRILQGMNVETLEMTYRLGQTFQLRVTLVSPYGGAEAEPYVSDRIEDAALVRHLAIMRMNGRPVLAGFYPLRVD